MRLAVLLLVLIPLVGCDTVGDDGLLDGWYEGVGVWTEDGLSYAPLMLTLLLSEDAAGGVTGSGVLWTGESYAVEASGSHVPPAFALTLTTGGLGELEYSGVVRGDSLFGALEGFGPGSIPLDLGRSE